MTFLINHAINPAHESERHPFESIAHQENGMSTAKDSYYVNCFKFQSQYFFKLLAATSREPELKGSKALNVFARFIHCKDFNSANIELLRIPDNPKRKSAFRIHLKPDQLMNEPLLSGLNAAQCQRVVDLFYRQNWDWHIDANIREALIASLRKASCLTHIPYRENSDFGDYLAVDLFNLGEKVSGERWHVLFRSQLVSIIMLLKLLFDHGDIDYFDFQDIIDCLEPNNYIRLSMLYSTLINRYLSDLPTMHGERNTVEHCFDKVLNNLNPTSLESSYVKFQGLFNHISGKRLVASKDKLCIIDYFFLKYIHQHPDQPIKLQSKSFLHLRTEELLENPYPLNSFLPNNDSSNPINLANHITEKGKQYIVNRQL